MDFSGFEWKKIAIGAGVFAALNFVWLYTYSLTRFSFNDAFDLNLVFKVASNSNAIAMLFVTGFLLAAALFIIAYFSHFLKHEETLALALMGGLPAFAAGLFWFSNKTAFFLMYAFYLAGCLFLAWGKPREINGLFDKLGAGLAFPKRVF